MKPRMTASQHRSLREVADAQTKETQSLIDEACDELDLDDERDELRDTIADWTEVARDGSLRWRHVPSAKVQIALVAIGVAAGAKLRGAILPLAGKLTSAGLDRVPQALVALAPVFDAPVPDITLPADLRASTLDKVLDSFDEAGTGYGDALSQDLLTKIGKDLAAGDSVAATIEAFGGEVEDDADHEDELDALADAASERATTRGQLWAGDAIVAGLALSFGAGLSSAKAEQPNASRMWLNEDYGPVCSICRPLDGEVRAPDEPFPNGETIPAHPRCRCEYVAVRGDWLDE